MSLFDSHKSLLCYFYSLNVAFVLVREGMKQKRAGTQKLKIEVDVPRGTNEPRLTQRDEEYIRQYIIAQKIPLTIQKKNASEMARSYTFQAIATLAQIMMDDNAPHAARGSAAVALLRRGWGPEEVPVEIAKAGGLDMGSLPIRERVAMLKKRMIETGTTENRGAVLNESELREIDISANIENESANNIQ